MGALDKDFFSRRRAFSSATRRDTFIQRFVERFFGILRRFFNLRFLLFGCRRRVSARFDPGAVQLCPGFIRDTELGFELLTSLAYCLSGQVRYSILFPISDFDYVFSP